MTAELYFIVMPLGVAVIFCAAQPTTDRAATATSIDLNILFPRGVLFSQHYLSQITNSSLAWIDDEAVITGS